MKILAVIVVVFTLAFLYFVGQEAGNPKSAAQRIEESCQKEYGSRGGFAVDECKVRLSVRALSEREQAKENAAYGRVR
jgi:hypothetical protein